MNFPSASPISLSPPIHVSQESRSTPRTTVPLESEASKGRQKSKRVFVIDDERSIADSLAEILNDSGYDARALYSGRAAIALARQACPDIVVSDVVMPAMDGVEAVLAISKICPGARIVLFSGQAGTGDILRRAKDAGHEFDLLPKPIHPDELLNILAALK
jgi:CheY-like chemotaxis protein